MEEPEQLGLGSAGFHRQSQWSVGPGTLKTIGRLGFTQRPSHSETQINSLKLKVTYLSELVHEFGLLLTFFLLSEAGKKQ
jgi:hypothetical protein